MEPIKIKHSDTSKLSSELTSGSLRGHFLIAMPGLADPKFSRSLTYICDHSDEGAMGVVVNQTLDIDLSEVYKQLKLPQLSNSRHQQVLAGGPVQVERGFVLHTAPGRWDGSMPVTDEICLTSSRDVLDDLSHDMGPEQFLVTLGYAGWGPGQLEEEIAENSWLTVKADSSILFNTPAEQRWAAAAKCLGIDMELMSASAGHS